MRVPQNDTSNVSTEQAGSLRQGPSTPTAITVDPPSSRGSLLCSFYPGFVVSGSRAPKPQNEGVLHPRRADIVGHLLQVLNVLSVVLYYPSK